jgi:hypothetical protein
MEGKGLLERAEEKRDDIAEADGFGDVEATAGITGEDRREIISKIEEITRGNRMDLSADRFAFKAGKRGFVLPLLVNLASLVVTAGALLLLSSSFAARESGELRAQANLTSAEGRLLQELKRDADSQMREKDTAINELRVRLEDLDKQRGELTATFDDRLKAKENELRASFEQELEKERQRLRGQGLSEDVINDRIAKIVAERESGLKQDLAEFKRRLDEERSAADARIAKLKEDYKGELAGLSEERARLQDEARKKEAELRATMDAKTRALEAAGAQATANLQTAQAELTRLSNERNSVKAAEDRIIGLYAAVKASLGERRFADAVADADALQAYLNDPSVVSVEALRSRRNTDLFAADSIGRYARAELERTKVDVASLARQADLLASIRTAATAATAAVAAGDAATAQTRYTEALSYVNETLEAHRYLTERVRQDAEARRNAAAAAAEAGGKAAREGAYAAASASFAESLELFGAPETSRSAIVDGLGRITVDRTDKERAEAQTRAIVVPLAEAKRAMSEGRWSDAVTSYAAILRTYPGANQIGEAVSGLEQTVVAWKREGDRRSQEDSQRAAVREADIQGRIAQLEKENQGLRDEIEKTRNQGDVGLASLARDKDARIAELEKSLADTTSQAAAAAAAAPSIAEVENLRRRALLADSYEGLTASYGRYSNEEDSLRAKSSTGLRARAALDSFLGDKETKKAFPDLGDRIGRYEREIAASSRLESLRNASAITESVLRLKDSAARDRYLSDVASRYKGDAEMSAFLDSLRSALR